MSTSMPKFLEFFQANMSLQPSMSLNLLSYLPSLLFRENFIGRVLTSNGLFRALNGEDHGGTHYLSRPYPTMLCPPWTLVDLWPNSDDLFPVAENFFRGLILSSSVVHFQLPFRLIISLFVRLFRSHSASVLTWRQLSQNPSGLAVETPPTDHHTGCVAHRPQSLWEFFFARTIAKQLLR